MRQVGFEIMNWFLTKLDEFLDWLDRPRVRVDLLPNHGYPGDEVTIDVFHGPFQVLDSPYPDDGC